MKLVIDASVAIKWFLWETQNEPNAATALEILRRILSSADEILQPPHWKAEVLAVLVRERPDQSAGAVHFLETIKMAGGNWRPHDTSNLVYGRACDLSERLKHHLFDTLYHAVALENDATLITADERYFVVAAPEGNIQRLRDYTPA